jgi:hypothetical protein
MRFFFSFFLFFLLQLPFSLNVCSQDISAQLPEPFQQQSPTQQTDDFPIDPCVNPDLPCPIDNYLYILLGIGVLYGIKKMRDQKKTASDWK